MIKHFCDLCNKETSVVDMKTVHEHTFFSMGYIKHEYEVCWRCAKAIEEAVNKAEEDIVNMLIENGGIINE